MNNTILQTPQTFDRINDYLLSPREIQDLQVERFGSKQVLLRFPSETELPLYGDMVANSARVVLQDSLPWILQFKKDEVLIDFDEALTQALAYGIPEEVLLLPCTIQTSTSYFWKDMITELVTSTIPAVIAHINRRFILSQMLDIDCFVYTAKSAIPLMEMTEAMLIASGFEKHCAQTVTMGVHVGRGDGKAIITDKNIQVLSQEVQGKNILIVEETVSTGMSSGILAKLLHLAGAQEIIGEQCLHLTPFWSRLQKYPGLSTEWVTGASGVRDRKTEASANPHLAQIFKPLPGASEDPTDISVQLLYTQEAEALRQVRLWVARTVAVQASLSTKRLSVYEKWSTRRMLRNTLQLIKEG